MRGVVDLRSDTVSFPGPEMRKFLAKMKAREGRRDEEVAVRALEEHAAGLFRKEGAFFVPSATMGNLCAVAAWARPGDCVLASSASQIAGRESPGISHLAAVSLFGIDAPGGIFGREEVLAAIGSVRTSGRGCLRVGLVSAENTHNAGGGTIFPVTALRKIHAACRGAGVAFHIDGTRIFNAVVATGVSPAKFGAACSSLMFCLSKSLGAPAGAVVVGEKAFLAEARDVAMRMGGKLRMAGTLAAAGLYALRNNVERLAQDHENAHALADGLRAIPAVQIVNRPVETNIVLLRWKNPAMSLPVFRQACGARGILLDDRGFPNIRLVTHAGIGKREVARVLKGLAEIAAESFAPPAAPLAHPRRAAS